MTLVSLLLGAALTIAASGASIVSPDLFPTERIRVLSVSHEIDFPREVVLTLEAEAIAGIADVTLFYRLGSQKVSMYGYPEFQRAGRVSADLRIKTGGASYLPTGTDIAYYYVIEDAKGNTFQTATYHVEYKDPAYNWQRFQVPGLTLLWHDRPEDLVVPAAMDASRRLAEVRRLLGLEQTGPMKAVILNTRDEARRSFPNISETTINSYGGFAFGELDIFVLLGLDGDGIVHEMTHLLIDEALDSPLAIVPAWLNEGLAMYYETDSSRRKTTLLEAARNDELMSVHTMDSVPGKPRDIQVFYAQSWGMVNHMMDSYGPDQMAALLAAINTGNRVEEAVARAYSVTLEELLTDWKARLVQEAESVGPVGRSRPPVEQAETSVTLVAAAVLPAVAALIAVLVLAIQWLRRIATRPEARSTNAADTIL